ncbi:MAG: family 43 glycosylhydrolase [Verrucomicrobia bacterium]|nr:family 43 glycosylhydrolase [Verrucomicrobiota bacterium]MBI3867657.1 family 43 glycosylhydrolase [Verrucomicrobiota bacterium]
MAHATFILLLPLLASATIAAIASRLTYCNPVDIDYQYNFEQKARGISYRSAADPVIITHKGEYYLFATISGGWWRSKDLKQWRYVKPDVAPHSWPKEDMCAPAAVSVGDQVYLFQSTFERRPLWVTSTPGTGRLTQFNPLMPQVPGAAGPWDPALFHDDDTDRWFMYFGSSNVYPLYGIELDFARQLSYRGTAGELVGLRPELHGWERFGPNHTSSIKPFIEGAWMTKHRGKYYLQYAGPGTEFNVYANGAYIGDGPLGPFSYAPNNPISYKPGGFVTGAGHGNTFQDLHGNFWNTGTPWVAVNFDFERRIALFPAGFDTEGLLFANTRFGDFPHYLPTERWTNKDALFTGWMLLSYRKPAEASSYRGVFSPANATDENPRTYWVADSNKPGEWLAVDLGRECEVRAVQVNFTDYKSGIYATDHTVYTQFKIQVSSDQKTWRTVVDLTSDPERRDRANAYQQLAQPERARYVRYEHVHVASPHLAISDLRVFGHGRGPAPATPARFAVRRDGQDPRNAFVTWDDVPDAVGYNILWGIRSDKLYQTYQVFADQRPALELRALSLGQGYTFAIEAFNENGVSQPSERTSVE